MSSPSPDLSSAKPSCLKSARVAMVLGFALLTVPGLVHAQAALPFADLIFIERGVLGVSPNEYDGGALCDQYYGHNGLTGGGLFLIMGLALMGRRRRDQR